MPRTTLEALKAKSLFAQVRGAEQTQLVLTFRNLLSFSRDFCQNRGWEYKPDQEFREDLAETAWMYANIEKSLEAVSLNSAREARRQAASIASWARDRNEVRTEVFELTKTGKKPVRLPEKQIDENAAEVAEHKRETGLWKAHARSGFTYKPYFSAAMRSTLSIDVPQDRKNQVVEFAAKLDQEQGKDLPPEYKDKQYFEDLVRLSAEKIKWSELARMDYTRSQYKEVEESLQAALVALDSRSRVAALHRSGGLSDAERDLLLVDVSVEKEGRGVPRRVLRVRGDEMARAGTKNRLRQRVNLPLETSVRELVTALHQKEFGGVLQAPDKSEKLQPGNRISVQRSSGKIEDDWTLLSFDTESGSANVGKKVDGNWILKTVPREDFFAHNPPRAELKMAV